MSKSDRNSNLGLITLYVICSWRKSLMEISNSDYSLMWLHVPSFLQNKGQSQYKTINYINYLYKLVPSKKAWLRFWLKTIFPFWKFTCSKAFLVMLMVNQNVSCHDKSEIQSLQFFCHVNRPLIHCFSFFYGGGGLHFKCWIKNSWKF